MNIVIITIILVFIIFINYINPYWLNDLKTFSFFMKIKNNKFTEVPFKKRKILIITTENRNDSYVKLHDTNFTKYCGIHGYEYLRLGNCQIEEASTYWCKIHKVKQGLSTGKYDYVAWCDSDTIITDYQTPLDYFISKVGEPNIIINTEYNGWLFNPLNFINAGVFLIKNTEIGKSFINDCLNEISKKPWCIKDGKEQGFWAGHCYEQGVMNELIRTKKYSNTVYIDYTNSFILNLPKITQLPDFLIKKPTHLGLITHLPGQTSNDRIDFFKKFV